MDSDGDRDPACASGGGGPSRRRRPTLRWEPAVSTPAGHIAFARWRPARRDRTRRLGPGFQALRRRFGDQRMHRPSVLVGAASLLPSGHDGSAACHRWRSHGDADRYFSIRCSSSSVPLCRGSIMMIKTYNAVLMPRGISDFHNTRVAIISTL